MKRIAKVLICFCCVITCCIVATACDFGHNFSTEWTTSATHHWRECKDEGCVEIARKEEHIFSEWQYKSDEKESRTCTVCEYEEEREHQLATELSKDANRHWYACENDTCEGSVKVFYIFTNWQYKSDEKESRTCTVCEYKEERNHSYFVKYNYNETEHWSKCTTCKQVIGKEEHSFSEWQYKSAEKEFRACTVCQYEEERAHVYDGDWTLIKNATQYEPAKYGKTCTGCGHIYEIYENEICTQGLSFELNNTKTAYIVSGYTGTAEKVFIPKLYNNKLVKEIKEKAFYRNKTLTEVVIPNGVTSIGEDAFNGCTYLTSVVIPNSVTSIGNGAFVWCTGLKKVNITSLESWMDIDFGISESNPLRNGAGLYLNNDLVTELMIPKTVTEIKAHSFYGYTSLTSVVIETSGTIMGQSAFAGCTSLTKVVILNRVTCISDNAFADCTSLTEVFIPYGLEIIAYAAFSGCTSLTSVEIPSSVWSIAGSAFNGCTSLTKVVIPNKVTSINVNTFNGCTSLTEVVIPEGVTSIGKFAFAGCTSLTEVKIPDCVTKIEENVFNGCTSLTSVVIPNSVISIGKSAFARCTSLKEIEIPKDVIIIESEVFMDCTSLKSVTIASAEIASSLTSQTAMGYLINYAKTIYLKNDLVATSNIRANYDLVEDTLAEGYKEGYKMYTKKATA